MASLSSAAEHKLRWLLAFLNASTLDRVFISDLLGNGWHSPEVIDFNPVNFSLTHFELLFKPQINISLK